MKEAAEDNAGLKERNNRDETRSDEEETKRGKDHKPRRSKDVGLWPWTVKVGF